MTAFFELPVSFYVQLLIAFIAVIIICRWLAKRMINAGKSKAYAINAKSLIYAGFACAAFVWLVLNVITFEKQTRFKRDKWIADKNMRHEMADDLIQSEIIARKDTNEVKEIIGEPDQRDDSLRMWGYNMGEGGGGFGFKVHYLIVEFAGNSVSSVIHQKIVD